MRNVITVVTIGALVALPSPAVAAPAPGITWHACARGADDAEGAALDEAGVDCADVTVPLDHSRPGGRTITIAVARSRATDPAHRVGAMIINLGGPGSPVRSVVPDARAAMGEAGARFDLIGMDPRFAGRSTPIDCGWPESWLPRSAGATRASFQRIAALNRDLARRCTDDRLRHASSADIARDMDRIRAALGDAKLSYLGYSYGTYLGAVYAQLFPQRAGRIVLDSAVDPATPGTLGLRGTAGFRQRMLEEWAGHAPAELGRDRAEVLATVDGIYRASAHRPLAVGDLRIDDTLVPAILARLLSDDNDDELTGAALIQLARAAKGEPATATDEIAEVVASAATPAESAIHTAQTATMCADAPVSRDVPSYLRDIERHRASSPIFEPLGRTVTPCAFQPPPAGKQVRIGNTVPALIVQAEKDINSQLAEARNLHRALRGSRMVTLAGARTHGVYLFRGDECVNETVNSYLISGVLPGADKICGP